MTITRSFTATCYQQFLSCTANAPEGVFDDAKEIRDTIGYLADETIRRAKALGLDVCNADGIFNLEIETYGYLRRKNVDRFLGMEGYGKVISEAEDGLRERINAGLVRDRDFPRVDESSDGMSAVRRRLAKRIEEAMLEQHGIEAVVDPDHISFPSGFYRSSPHADAYRWTAFCKINGTNYGPSIDSYDTATKCAANGITIDRLPFTRGYEATALENKNDSLAK